MKWLIVKLKYATINKKGDVVMNLFQLECFLAVAEHLNFARAAEQINLSQPSITHQIQSLENELTVKLFKRSTRCVELTRDGRIFLDDAKNIVFMSKTAISRFTNSDNKQILDLSVGCYSFSEFQILTDVFRKLYIKYNNLHPRIFNFPDSQLLSRVEDDFLDVALKVQDNENRKVPLIYKELTKISFICVMKSDYHLASFDSISLNDVKQEKLILYNPIHAGSATAQFQWKLAEGRKPSDLYFCESPEAAIILTAAGFGISFLPDFHYLPKGLDLKTIPVADVESFSYGLYYKNYQEKPYLRDFINYIQKV